MFGIMEALLSFIRRQVGLRTDVDSSTGSLHAKVGYIKTYLAGIKKKGFIKTSFSSSSTSYQTALNVSGSGKLDILSLTASATANPTVKITIDGNVICDIATGTISSGTYKLPGVGFPFLSTAALNWNYVELATAATCYVPFTPLCLEFKSSLKIEVKGDNANTITTGIGYSLDS